VRDFLAGLMCVSVFSVSTVHAVQTISPAKTDLLGLAGFLALGTGVVALSVLLYLSYFAVFIHLATRLAGYKLPFSHAFSALLINFLLQILTTMAVAVFLPNNHLAFFLAYWMSAAGSIMISYNGTFMRSLLAAVLAVVLTLAGTVATVMILVAVFPMLLPER